MLQRFDNNSGHFGNKFFYKVDTMNYDFSNKIADCKQLLKFPLKIFQKFFIRKFGIVDKVTECDAEFESSQR